MLEAGHDIYQTGENEALGYGCRRCSLWARGLWAFRVLSCPPPDGR